MQSTRAATINALGKTFTEWVPQLPPRCRITARLREQGEPVDAAAGELVEDLQVVSWESKTSSPGSDPVALFQ
jgi:hypothetical protein